MQIRREVDGLHGVPQSLGVSEELSMEIWGNQGRALPALAGGGPSGLLPNYVQLELVIEKNRKLNSLVISLEYPVSSELPGSTEMNGIPFFFSFSLSPSFKYI